MDPTVGTFAGFIVEPTDVLTMDIHITMEDIIDHPITMEDIIIPTPMGDIIARPTSGLTNATMGGTMMVNTSNWDKFSKRIVLGLVMPALVAAVFLLLGIYIVGAEEVNLVG